MAADIGNQRPRRLKQRLLPSGKFCTSTIKVNVERMCGTQVRNKRVIAILAICIAAGHLASCTDGGEISESEVLSLEQLSKSAKEDGYDWQASLLEDGDITLDEFDEAYRKTFDCLEAGGLVVSDLQRNVADGFRWEYVIEFGNVPEGEALELSSKCEDEFTRELQTAMSYWGDWETPQAVLGLVKDCVESRGVEVDASARNYVELYESVADLGVSRGAVLTCLNKAVGDIYGPLDIGFAL